MSIFQRLFGKQTQPQPLTVQLLSGSPVFSPWSGDAYASDIYRGAVDAIARNAAKLKGSHVVRQQTHITPQEGCKLNRVLQIEPNPYMSAFDLFYKLVTHYYLYNNAFAFLQKDERGEIMGIFPIRPANMEFLADPSGALYCKFLFQSGKEATLPYADIVHLRRNFNYNDLLGDPNDALTPALELAHTQNEGIISGIKSAANIRGILKFTQIMAPERLIEEKDRFMADYLTMANSGGIIVTDQKTDYAPIETKPVTVDEKQMSAAKLKIFDYLGISEKIVNSGYSEDEWAAFYESTIEPLAVQLSLEFTRKIFTDREQAFGNSITFEANRLQFASARTKIEMIKELAPMKLLTRNQALGILNLPAVPDGDEYIQSLNYIDARIAESYQINSVLNNSKKGVD